MTLHNRPKAPSLQEAQQRIAELKRLTLDADTDIDFLKERLSLLFTGFQIRTPILERGLELYRGVLWNDKPSTVSQLTYPPRSAVKFHQRVNRAGESRFYCSVVRSAPFFELRMSPGQHVALSKWRLREKLVVNNVGYTNDVFARLKSTRTDLPSWRTDSPVEDPVNELIMQFFSEQFLQDVLGNSDHIYKLSIAIAEKHFGNIKMDQYTTTELPSDLFSDRRFAGLIYPALAMRANGDNLVFLPEFVDRCVELVSVEYIRVDAVSGELKYDITTLDLADTFTNDGLIEWKGGVPGWVIPSGSGIKLRGENGVWVARNDKGEIVKAQPPTTPPSNEPVSRLHDLFKSDLPNLFKTYSDVTASIMGGSKYTIPVVLYRDFETRSLFVGFYMPSAPLMYQICASLADAHKKIVEDLAKSALEIQLCEVTTAATDFTTTELIFNNQFIIYHEDDWSSQQLTDLERLYRDSGLSVEFRGPSYLLARWG